MSSILMLLVVLVAAAYIAIGIVVLQRNVRSFTNRCFASAAAMMAVWLVSNYLSDRPAALHARLLFLNRLTVASGILSVMLIFALGLAFPHKDARIPLAWKLAFLPPVLLAVLSLTTPLLVAEVTVEPWGTNIVLGPAYVLIVAWGILCGVGLAVNAYRRYRVAAPREQVQFRWLGLGIGSFLSVTILLTGILPYVLGNNRPAQLVPFAALLFLLPTAYAMRRHRLLDLNSSAVRGAIYSLGLAGAAATLVVLAARWLDEIFTPLGVDSRIGLFVVGMGAILAFAPLRYGIDRLTDKYLRQRTYDPDELLRRLGGTISANVHPEDVATAIAETLAREMKLSFASVVFVRDQVPTSIDSGSVIPDLNPEELLGVVTEGRLLVADDLETDAPAWAILSDQSARVVVPLRFDDVVSGAVVLGSKLSGRGFSQVDVRFLDVLAAEAGIALQNAALLDERSRNLEQLGRSLASIVQIVSTVAETRDPYTAGHQRRVSELAVRISEDLGLTTEEIEEIRIAALLHDIGKMSIPAEILSRPGKLSDIEFELIKGHSEAGYKIISSADMQGPTAEIVYEHHERCDGSGYPRGLHGDEMLTASKVIAVADVVEAMSSHRPYRPALGLEPALAEIRRGAGTYYDADVAEGCLRVFEQGFSFSQQ